MNRSVILSRQLALVAYIGRYPGITVPELARHFEMRQAVIRGDIEVIDRAGFGDLLPGQTFELDMERYLKNGELELISSLEVHSAPRLTSKEAALLMLGLRAIAPGLSAQQSALVPSLMAEVLALAGGQAPVDLAQVVESNLPTRTWQQLHQAIGAKQQVQIRYISAVGRESVRAIDPLRFSRVEDAWLVEAWCHQTEQKRIFRLDRITDLEPLDLSQVHPSNASARDNEGLDCLVTLAETARWRLAEICATAEMDSDLTLRFRVWDQEWMVSQLLILAADIAQVAPPDMARQASRRAQEALAVWEGF